MKSIITVLSIFILISCSPKKEEVKKQDDFLKVYEYPDEKHSGGQNTVNTDESYWWVLVEDNDQETRRNAFIKQNHTYFSYAEAKQVFKDGSGKDCFILNFISVDKETYEHNSGE
jgi:hypothetical protein